jgi:hypothetical protein
MVPVVVRLRASPRVAMVSDELLTSAPLGVILANPKSSILACPRPVTNRLAGLMSRWMMPSLCAASSASAISMPSESTVSSGVGQR